jgi:hypothetical protein
MNCNNAIKLELVFEEINAIDDTMVIVMAIAFFAIWVVWYHYWFKDISFGVFTGTIIASMVYILVML